MLSYFEYFSLLLFFYVLDTVVLILGNINAGEFADSHVYASVMSKILCRSSWNSQYLTDSSVLF